MKKMKKKIKSKEIDYNDIESEIVDIDHYEPKMNMVIYGKAGTGKTTLAATFPKPILFIDCREKGTESISDSGNLVKQIRIKDFIKFDSIYWYLRKKKKYKTVVIDTLSQGQDLCIKKVMEDSGRDIDDLKLGHWGTMTKQMWGQVSSEVKAVITKYADIDEVIAVFIAHEKALNDSDDNSTEQLDPSIGPRLSPATVAFLNGTVDIIGNTFIRERTAKVKVKGKIVKKKITEYGLRIGPNSLYITKIRKPKKFLLPETIIDPSYDKIREIVKGNKGK